LISREKKKKAKRKRKRSRSLELLVMVVDFMEIFGIEFDLAKPEFGIWSLYFGAIVT
jgi:hypothetical protein